MAEFEFSTCVNDVTANLLRLHSYALGTAQERKFHFNRLYNAVHLVYYETTEDVVFAPVKWCAVKENSIARYSARERGLSWEYHSRLSRLGFSPILSSQPSYDKIYQEFVDFCYGFGFKGSVEGIPHSASQSRQFWKLNDQPEIPFQIFSDEVLDPENYIEGATRTVAVNSYERSSKARLACIAHYGWTCQACKIDFRETYGELGKEFIHVHHLRPLHQINDEYQVHPVNDLRPVCPNCHAMIHRQNPPLSIEELSEKIIGRRN